MVEPQSFLPLQGNGEFSEQGRPQTRLWWVPASNCKWEGGGFFFYSATLHAYLLILENH